MGQWVEEERADVSHFIVGHEQTQLNRVCIFISLVYFWFPKELIVQNFSKDFYCIWLFHILSL